MPRAGSVTYSGVALFLRPEPQKPSPIASGTLFSVKRTFGANGTVSGFCVTAAAMYLSASPMRHLRSQAFCFGFATGSGKLTGRVTVVHRIERRVLEIIHVREHRLDAVDLAVANLEGFDQRDGVRPLQERLALLAVRREVRVERVRVIEEARGDHDAALFVDERITTLADALVDAIDAELELILAALRDRAQLTWRSRCCPSASPWSSARFPYARTLRRMARTRRRRSARRC